MSVGHPIEVLVLDGQDCAIGADVFIDCSDDSEPADILLVLGREVVAIDMRSRDDFVRRKPLEEGTLPRAGAVANRAQAVARILRPPAALVFDGRGPRRVRRNGRGYEEEPANNGKQVRAKNKKVKARQIFRL